MEYVGAVFLVAAVYTPAWMLLPSDYEDGPWPDGGLFILTTPRAQIAPGACLWS